MNDERSFWTSNLPTLAPVSSLRIDHTLPTFRLQCVSRRRRYRKQHPQRVRRRRQEVRSRISQRKHLRTPSQHSIDTQGYDKLTLERTTSPGRKQSKTLTSFAVCRISCIRINPLKSGRHGRPSTVRIATVAAARVTRVIVPMTCKVAENQESVENGRIRHD